MTPSTGVCMPGPRHAATPSRGRPCAAPVRCRGVTGCTLPPPLVVHRPQEGLFGLRRWVEEGRLSLPPARPPAVLRPAPGSAFPPPATAAGQAPRGRRRMQARIRCPPAPSSSANDEDSEASISDDSTSSARETRARRRRSGGSHPVPAPRGPTSAQTRQCPEAARVLDTSAPPSPALLPCTTALEVGARRPHRLWSVHAVHAWWRVCHPARRDACVDQVA